MNIMFKSFDLVWLRTQYSRIHLNMCILLVRYITAAFAAAKLHKSAASVMQQIALLSGSAVYCIFSQSYSPETSLKGFH